MNNIKDSPENKLIQCQNNSPKLDIPQIQYSKAPPKKSALRQNDAIVQLTSNLKKLSFSDPLIKVYIYSIEISPEIAKDNFPVQKKLYSLIEPKLSQFFIKKTFAGYNLFGSTKNPQERIDITENVKDID